MQNCPIWAEWAMGKKGAICQRSALPSQPLQLSSLEEVIWMAIIHKFVRKKSENLIHFTIKYGKLLKFQKCVK